jgi:hypothetical protein
MSRRLIFAIAAGLALSGCCLGSGQYFRPPGTALTHWDGFAPFPVRNGVKAAKAPRKSEAVASDDSSAEEAELAGKEAELAHLEKYSAEWRSLREAIDRAREAKLSKKLIICRDCMPSNLDDAVASITPK